MNSPRASSSPSYRNMRYQHSQSPIELKEKMRKDYKNKIQNCRNMLMNRFRGHGDDLRQTLTDLYKTTFDFGADLPSDVEENELLEEIKKDLIQEELEWCLEEYEKSQTDSIDWSIYQTEENIICPVCQKNDFKLDLGVLSCEMCKIEIKTQLPLAEIKNIIYESIESHSKKCNSNFQFSMIPEINENHIYLICDICLEMQLIL